MLVSQSAQTIHQNMRPAIGFLNMYGVLVVHLTDCTLNIHYIVSVCSPNTFLSSEKNNKGNTIHSRLGLSRLNLMSTELLVNI